MSKTSWQAKARYNGKHYKRIGADLDKDLVNRLEERLAADNITKAEFIRQAIEAYLSEPSE